MIRIAVVGTGIIANSHFNAIEKIDDCTLACIAEVKPELAKEVGEKYGVPYYIDYKEMAEREEFDAVILNLPHFLHCEASVFFLDRGIHVLCEKPMANTVEECDRMIEAEKRSKAKLAIGHVQRYFGSNEIVKKYVDEKILGELCMTTEFRNVFYFNEKRPRWFLDKKLSGGGILMNYGAHALDKLSYIVGNDFSNISGTCGNLLPGYDIEGHAQVKFTINGRISSTVTFCGYDSFGGYETVYYFTNGALKVSHSNTLTIYDKTEKKFVPLEFEEPVSPFEKEVGDFVKLVKGEESMIPRAEYSRNIIAVINEIYDQNA